MPCKRASALCAVASLRDVLTASNLGGGYSPTAQTSFLTEAKASGKTLNEPRRGHSCGETLPDLGQKRTGVQGAKRLDFARWSSITELRGGAPGGYAFLLDMSMV